MKRIRAAFDASAGHGSRKLPFPIIAFGLILAIACLYWAQAVLIPFALAILLTFLLSPAITALQRTGMGRVPSVALVIVITFCLLGTIGWVAGSQITSLAGELPSYRQNITQKIRDLRGLSKGSTLEKIQETVDEVQDEIERGERSAKSGKQGPVVVQAAPSASWRSLYLGPLAQPIASAGLVFALLIFMLAQREELRNRLIRLVGYGHLTITTKALEETGQRISRYLLMQMTINGCFGFVVAVALFLIGLPYALLWGFVSVPLLFIPLIGFWAAAAMPTILSLGVFTSWWWPLVVIGLFSGLKSIINFLLEPLLYGRSVGVSPVPLLMMIAFWTWLWGPIGLLLATPLTVCLVVFAKHVPQLEFVGMLLSDEPAMQTEISFYQRLLAMDKDEAVEVLEGYLKNHPGDQVYDEVLIPALNYAKEDRRRNNITEREEQFVFKAMREIIEKRAASERRVPAGSANGAENRSVENGARRVRIVGCPAHDESDEIALLMLRQLFDSTRYEVEIVSARVLASERIARVSDENPHLVCISALPPGGVAQARYLCKRLRALFPKVKIVVGRWGFSGELDENRRFLLAAGVDQVGMSLRETRDQITKLRQLMADVELSTAPGSAPDVSKEAEK